MCAIMTLTAIAGNTYVFDATCRQAYGDITSLRINSGQQLVNKAKQEHPDNLIPDLLQGYIDFFVLFFNEDPAEYKSRKEGLEQRIDLFKDGNQQSPYYNYCISVAYLQKAMIAIKFNERFSAFLAFKKAFGYIKRQPQIFPGFSAQQYDLCAHASGGRHNTRWLQRAGQPAGHQRIGKQWYADDAVVCKQQRYDSPLFFQ